MLMAIDWILSKGLRKQRRFAQLGGGHVMTPDWQAGSKLCSQKPKCFCPYFRETNFILRVLSSTSRYRREISRKMKWGKGRCEAEGTLLVGLINYGPFMWSLFS